MAADAPIPTPIPAAAAADPAADTVAGSLDQFYDPVGAMGGRFAPAYVRGYAPSEAAVAAWQAKNRPLDGVHLDTLRMPEPWQAPQQPNPYGGDVYGSGRIPDKMSFITTGKGRLDDNILRSWSQGGPYDVDARRNAIAKRLTDNEAAQKAYTPPKQWWEM